MDNIHFTVETIDSYDLDVDSKQLFELFGYENPSYNKDDFKSDSDGMIYDWLMDKFDDDGRKVLEFIKENCKISVLNFKKETSLDLNTEGVNYE